MKALKPADDPEPVVRALRALLATPCFALARTEGPPSLEADSGLAMAAWWKEGGEAWLESYLELGLRKGTRTVVLPPAMRSTLSRETLPGHPLSHLLCPLGDAVCGASTRGWRSRADAVFEQAAERDREQYSPDGKHWRDELRACTTGARAAPAAERYARWYRCLQASAPLPAALPYGPTEAPRDGWFVVVGRRGHYNFCDQLSAYDLATGSAYTVKSCSALALQDGGSVDQHRTDAGRSLVVQRGTLPRDNLREAVWMTLLTDVVEAPAVRGSEWFEVPSDIEVVRASIEGFGRGGGRWGSSAQTRLSWSYMREGRSLAAGHLTWPNDSRAAYDHAVKLLALAESGFVKECVKARPPARLDLGGGKPGVSSIDASAESLRQAYGGLVTAYEALRNEPLCPR